MSDADPYHYGVIARAIAEIDAAGGAPLPLDDLAARLRMSPAHFQRLFSRWVGVSPKRYQQYLALDHARALLAARHTVLQASDAVGLSGAGRLHDLFLRWEAMSPGAYAAGGDGLVLRWAWAETPFGPALGVATDVGLCGLGFAGDMGAEAVMADMAARWPAARMVRDEGAVRLLIDAALSGRGGRLHLIGPPFQIKVWEALLAIPPGHVTTYGDIARVVCSPAAARAVGTAVGRNPLGFVIPCHRVIRRGGALGGYRWGLPVKRAMLAWEAARADAGDAAG